MTGTVKSLSYLNRNMNILSRKQLEADHYRQNYHGNMQSFPLLGVGKVSVGNGRSPASYLVYSNIVGFLFSFIQNVLYGSK